MKQSDLDDLRDVRTREELLAGVVRLGETMGFSISTVAYRQGRFGADATFNNVTNAPQKWVARASDKEMHRIDPVFNRLNTSREPFFYDADFYAKAGAGQLWEIASPYGFYNGVSASLYLGAERVLFWGFDSDGPLPKDDARRMRLLSDTVLIGVMACTAAAKVLGPDEPLLSESQLEALRHARQGRSSWHIAQLMGIGEDTVNYHLKRCRSILGVATRHQAVAKAMELGLLED